MALMFAYDMQQTASRNLGWQTHYLSLAYTPRKAMSAIIAAEAMRRLPRMRSYGAYPENTRFGDFHVSYEENLGELVARDAFLYAGSTRTVPPEPAALRRIAGYGSSPWWATRARESTSWTRCVRAYGVSRSIPMRCRCATRSRRPAPTRIVTRAISRAWPMTIALPDLGGRVQGAADHTGRPGQDRFRGTFLRHTRCLSAQRKWAVDPATLPAKVGALGFAEYHPPPADTLPLSVHPLAPPELVTGREGEVRARVVDLTAPDSVLLFVRPNAGGWFQRFWMRPAGGYHYAAAIPAGALREGPSQFVITVYRGGVPVTFPGVRPRRPWDWDWTDGETWPLDVTSPRAPLQLFAPRTDAARLAFTRIGDAGRRGLFRLGVSEVTGQPIFHLELPVDSSGWSPADYTASLVIRDRIGARRDALAGADALRLRIRGLGPRQILHVTLMEDDGTSWTTAVPLDSTWSEPSLPLAGFAIGRGVLLPQGFPGAWSYWVGPATGRGGSADRPRLDRIERLQLSLRREDGVKAVAGGYGVEVEWIQMHLAIP